MKWKTLLIAAVMLAALFVTPASALEYTFDSPSTGDFGTPTSDETIYEWEDPNVDRSKSSALIPPGFGTPTSYLPNSGVYLTPNLAAGGPLNSPALTGTIISVGGGATVLPGAVDAPVSTYPTASYPTASAPATAFTDVTADLYYGSGVNNHFGKIHTLTAGDTVTLTTQLGTRTYSVTSVEKVSVTDSSGTAATTDNRITLYTCVMNQPDYRWRVTATES